MSSAIAYCVISAEQYTGWPGRKSASIKNHHKIASAAIFLINVEYKMSIRMLLVCIRYSMCDLISDVISCCV